MFSTNTAVIFSARIWRTSAAMAAAEGSASVSMPCTPMNSMP